MKKILVVLGLMTFVVFSNAQPTNQTSILYPLKGMEGIIFNQSTEDEVIARFGADYRTEEIFVKQYFNKEQNQKVDIYNYKMIFATAGVVFNFTKIENQKENLTSIEVTKPYKAKTIEGIVLNESTLRDAIKLKGEGRWGYSNDNHEVVISYDGIIFSVPNKKKIKEFDKEEFEALFLDKVVEKITITIDPAKAMY